MNNGRDPQDTGDIVSVSVIGVIGVQRKGVGREEREKASLRKQWPRTPSLGRNLTSRFMNLLSHPSYESKMMSKTCDNKTASNQK